MIKSVRQSMPAPQEPIMGGALQGFGAFANNLAAKKKQEQDQQNKLGLSLLTAAAQQDRTVTPDAQGGIKYGGQGYSVGNKSVNPLQLKRSMDIGDTNITPEYKRIKAEQKASDQLGKSYKWLEKSTSKSAQKRQEARAELDNLTALYMNEEITGGTSSSGGFDWAKKLGSEISSVLPSHIAARAMFGNKKDQVVPQSLQKPNFVPMNGIDQEVSQADWDNASSEEQRKLLDYYGL